MKLQLSATAADLATPFGKLKGGTSAVFELTPAQYAAIKATLDGTATLTYTIVGGDGLVSTTTTPYAPTTEEAVLVDATAGNMVVNLPAATLRKGSQLVISKVDASANTVTVNRAGSDTVEGATSVVLTAQWDKLVLLSDGVASWGILASVVTP